MVLKRFQNISSTFSSRHWQESREVWSSENTVSLLCSSRKRKLVSGVIACTSWVRPCQRAYECLGSHSGNKESVSSCSRRHRNGPGSLLRHTGPQSLHVSLLLWKKTRKVLMQRLPLLMQGLGSSRLEMAGKGQELPHSRTASKTASCHIFQPHGMD